MKSIKYIIIASAVLVGFASCSKNDDEDINKSGKVTMTFGVGSEAGMQTRAYVSTETGKGVNSSNPTIYWKLGDEISIFSTADNSNNKFTATKLGGNSFDNSAYFTGEMSATVPEYYYFLYPYQSQATIDASGYIHAEIPATQNANEGTFDPNAMVQVGRISGSTRDNVNLKNVCSFLWIKLPQYIDKVEVTSNGTYGVGGKVKVQYDPNGSVISDWDDRYPTVTLQNIGGKAGTYVICVASSDAYPKLKVTVYPQSGHGTAKSAEKTPGTLQAGYFYSLGDLSEVTF